MTYTKQFNVNNVVAQLEAGIIASSVTVLLKTGQGAQFGDDFPMKATLVKRETISGNSVVTKREIVLITARVADTLTITRGHEACIQNDTVQPPVQSSIPLSFEANDFIEHTLTAGDLGGLKQEVEDIGNNAVYITGNQTIGGIKTFTSVVKGISPVENADFTTKQYVDNEIQSALVQIVVSEENINTFPIVENQYKISFYPGPTTVNLPVGGNGKSLTIKKMTQSIYPLEIVANGAETIEYGDSDIDMSTGIGSCFELVSSGSMRHINDMSYASPTPIYSFTVSSSGTARGSVIDGNFMYVCIGNTLEKFDFVTMTSIGTVATGTNAEQVVINNGFAYVSCTGSNRVDKIDLSTYTNVGNVAVGTAPYGLVVDNGFLYVGCSTSNRVDKIDLSTYTNVANVAIANSPRYVSTDGTYIYVTRSGTNLMSRIDISSFTAGSTATVANNPYYISVAGGFAFVSCGTGAGGSLHKVDLSSMVSVANIGSLNQPNNTVVLDGYVYLATRDTNAIMCIDVTAFTSLGTIAGISSRSISIGIIGGKYVLGYWVSGNTIVKNILPFTPFA